MNYLKLFIITLFPLLTIAQEVEVKISGTIFGLNESDVVLSQNTGMGFQDFKTTKLSKDGKFEIKTTVPGEDYYILRVGEKYVNLILRKGSDIKVYGDGNKLDRFSNIVGSDESSNLNKFAGKLDQWNKLKDSATMVVQTDPSKGEQINADMKNHYQEFQNDFQTFVSENQNMPSIIVALGVIDPSQDFASYESVVKQLESSFPQSKTVQSVLQGYAQQKAQREAANALGAGKAAPDFEELMLDRKTKMKLSDLKGKVVLLDFWASWCGPCRKENPNVVDVYNRYKDKGFTVMSVSLDDNLDRWKQAIDQDGLTWPNHVSDLKKWSSAAAQKYAVKGIPFTVLIDQEGNIIETNLRGPALEEALIKILGK